RYCQEDVTSRPRQSSIRLGWHLVVLHDGVRDYCIHSHHPHVCFCPKMVHCQPDRRCRQGIRKYGSQIFNNIGKTEETPMTINHASSIPKPAPRRFATAAAAFVLSSLALAALAIPANAADPTEIVYATFLDPNNQNDPRAAAQGRMIETLEKANPAIKG